MDRKLTAFGEVSGILLGILEEAQNLYLEVKILKRQGKYLEASIQEKKLEAVQDEFLERVEKREVA